MKRYVTALSLLILFILFAVFIQYRQHTNTVIKIISPEVLQIDLNSNGTADDNEIICLPDIESFSLVLKDKSPEFAKNLNLSGADNISLNYAADEFANNLLSAKQVNLKFTGERNHNCRYAEIFVDNEKYSDLLFASGLAAKNGMYLKEQLRTQLKAAQKLNLVILNHKSYKYHKLNCDYGLLSSDYTIIPHSQIPKDAKPCKFCHVAKKKTKTSNTLQSKNIQPELSKTVMTDGNLRLILTDFTKNLKPDRNCDDNACLAILDAVNSAQKSIDIAVYGMDKIPAIYNALLAAKDRNVKIRMVYDKSSTPDKEYYKETHEIAKLADEFASDYSKNEPAYTNQLMHNKFFIIDKQKVITGSMNVSRTGTSGYNANSVLVIESADIAELYTAEFEQMLSGKFHNKKNKLTLPRKFNIGESTVSIYFSPYDKTMQYIIPLIDNAINYIYIPAFLITHNELTEALIRAKRRNVDVRVIVDANSTFTKNSKHSVLRENGILLKTENYAGKMHSKSIIIDDYYVVSGSMNFSNSGENKNDENLLIISNPKFAQMYEEYFIYLWEKIPDIYMKRNARAEGLESIGSCFDGVDNNFDGLIDSEDPACRDNN